MDKNRNKMKTFEKLGFKNEYEYQKSLAIKKGYRTPGEYRLAKGIDTIKDEWRVKNRYAECDPTAVEIPFSPGYYITPEAIIWKYAEKRECWLIISQQSHKSGYKAFQPYIDGKRHVKYVHRAVCAAFYGDCDGSYEAHHINGNRHNNTLGNLKWMPKDEHRRMKKNYRK